MAARTSAGSPKRSTDINRHPPRTPENGARKPFDHPRALFFVLLIVLLVVVEIGQLLSMRLSVDSDQWQLVAARDSVGLLLSLLLGFTLAMAISRHDQ
jgi:hypothetical protein